MHCSSFMWSVLYRMLWSCCATMRTLCLKRIWHRHTYTKKEGDKYIVQTAKDLRPESAWQGFTITSCALHIPCTKTRPYDDWIASNFSYMKQMYKNWTLPKTFKFETVSKKYTRECGQYLLELLDSAEENTHVALEAAHGETGHSGGRLKSSGNKNESINRSVNEMRSLYTHLDFRLRKTRNLSRPKWRIFSYK